MMRSQLSPIALAVPALASILTLACDTSDSDSAPGLETAAETAAAIAPDVAQRPDAFDWSVVPLPSISGLPADQVQSPSNDQAPAFGPWTVESFHFWSEPNFIALSQGSGNLFAPYPAEVEFLPPELSTGFLVGFTFEDEDDEIVGFGTEQEILDFESATGETTYTLTFPDRGTLMLSHEEEFAYLFEEINDMVADQEFVRVFNPPLVNIHTVPGSARVIGGTGEFTHEFGFWREISIVREINLLTGFQDVGIIIQVAHF